MVSFKEINLPGAKRKVYALIYQGQAEARLFFERKLDKVAQGRYLASLHRLAMLQPVPGEKYHPLDQKKSKRDVKDLAELKDLTSKTRFMVFSHLYSEPRDDGSCFTEKRLILLQGYQKKEDKLDEGEERRAITRRDYYLSQVSERIQQVTQKIESSRKSAKKR